MTSAPLLASLLVCLSQPPAEESPRLPEGIYGLTCRVVEVRGKDLLVNLDWPREDNKPVRLKTTGDSRFTPLRPAPPSRTNGRR